MPTPYDTAPATAGSSPVLGEGRAAPFVRARPALVRSRQRGWTPGVSAAVARHLRVSVRAVRFGFVVLTFAGGAGIAAYIFLWALTPVADVTDPGQHAGSGLPDERRQWGGVLAVGAALVVIGAVLLTPSLGGSMLGSVLLPLFAIAVGAIVAWSNLDEAQRSRWLGEGDGAGRAAWLRLGPVGRPVVGRPAP